MKYIVKEWQRGQWVPSLDGPMSLATARQVARDTRRTLRVPVRIVECTPDGIGAVVATEAGR